MAYRPFVSIPPSEFIESTLPVFKGIFNYPGSMLSLFTSKMKFRILDSFYGLIPDSILMQTFRNIGMREGYTGFYTTFLDITGSDLELWLPDPTKGEKVESWYVPFDEINRLKKIPFTISRTFYSPAGDWGILVTPENFLLLGCTDNVGEKLQASIPELENSASRFLQLYRQKEIQLNIKWGWIPELFHHMYDNKHDALLKEYNFNIY